MITATLARANPFWLSVLMLLFGARILAGPEPARSEKESLSGYAEFRIADGLVVEGQRVLVGPRTKLKARGVSKLEEIPLGWEVKVSGLRGADGSVLAEQLEAKPNGKALFEDETLVVNREVEELWLKAGYMYDEDAETGQRTMVGKILTRGPAVDRLREIITRLLPPYMTPEDIRIRLVESSEWNAAAMGNGSIWIYSSLLSEMTDDELAIILGHELAHYSHEHSRRAASRAIWVQLAAVGALAALEQAQTKWQVIGMGALLGITAWHNGYSRDQEDQADRVGLRYVSEAGFEVRQGPALWGRFRDKYGESDRFTNFLLGSHSRPSDRMKNLERELEINYQRIR